MVTWNCHERARKAAALKRAAEATHCVTIQYCAGCGFVTRAKELAKLLSQRIAVDAALIQDQNPTGRFDVCVRNKDGVFVRVHSKHDGDGFVDTEEKVTLIIDAIVEATVP